MKEAFTCYMSTSEILSFESPHTSWTHAFRVFKSWANISHCVGRIYCGDRFIRSTGDRWQDVPTKFDAECLADFLAYGK